MMTKAWPMVPLARVLRQRKEFITINDLAIYKRPRVQSHAKGIVLRDTVAGAEIKTKQQQVCRAGEFLVAEIDAKVGGFGIVPEDLAGSLVSSHYFLFEIDDVQLDRGFLGYFSRTATFRDQVAAQGSTNYAAIRPSDVLGYEMPLPPLDEQHRIVARIESLAAKIEEVRGLCRLIETDLDRTLLSAYHSIADNAVRKPMIEVAPLTRRPADISVEEVYQQVSVRSFGRGTFHQPDLSGSDITWQKPYLVKAGDILISNIKAWEGAIAVASENDDGRYGSHRYLTCVPVRGAATSRFVCFHLLTRDGLYEIGEASPGSADRNRTLNAKALMQIPIPVPPIEKQMWFDNLQVRVDAMKAFQAQTQAELDALLPSVLDRAFRGEL